MLVRTEIESYRKAEQGEDLTDTKLIADTVFKEMFVESVVPINEKTKKENDKIIIESPPKITIRPSYWFIIYINLYISCIMNN